MLLGSVYNLRTSPFTNKDTPGDAGIDIVLEYS
jgi:hypothetical protein